MTTNVNSTNRKTKSISFDLTDEYEITLLEHAESVEKGKFSRYIKRLIANDMDNRRRTVVSHEIVEEEAEVKGETVNAMKGFL